MMIGAIIGDIAGSRFEHTSHKSKQFELFTYECRPTDDRIMTIAVAKAIMESKKKGEIISDHAPFGDVDYDWLEELAVHYMQTIG